VGRQPLADRDSAIIVAVLFGASEFPHAEGLSASSAFTGAAAAFKEYLKSERGFHLPNTQVLDLFDSDASVIDQNERLIEHLQRHRSATDLIIYYVGHGGFLSDREYFLALRSTKRGAEGYTGLRIRALAQSLEESFPNKRVFLILDCCFAGEAVAQFQSGELATIVESKTFDALPEFGTSLLVAASKDEPAIAPIGAPSTMFSECLVEVLGTGIEDERKALSLAEVGEFVQKRVRSKFGQRAVRPEIHSPRQGGGDIARMPLFPNPAYRPPKPLELPGAIHDALRNPIADIRLGAVGSLTSYLEGGDTGLAALARAQLERLARGDDSVSVRKRARRALREPEDDPSPPEDTRPAEADSRPPPAKRGSKRPLVLVAVGMAILMIGAALWWVFTGSGIHPDPTGARIERLLDEAERAVSADRLDAPEGDNALERYRAVLRLDSENKTAWAGIDTVVNRLMKGAEEAIDRQALDDARGLLARASSIAPDYPGIAELGRVLDGARANPQETGRIEQQVIEASVADDAAATTTGEQSRVHAKAPSSEEESDDAETSGARVHMQSRTTVLPSAEELGTVEKIRRLLADAEADLENDRLTTPSGNNAVMRYRAVLALDNENQEALTGLDRVVDRYVELSNSAIAGGRFDAAESYLTKARRITPERPALASLGVRIRKEREAADVKVEKEEIQRLLAAAEQDFQQGRLDAPKGDNALESYRRVLARDPENDSAQAGIDRVAERFLALSGQAVDDRALDDARDYLARAVSAAPDHPELAALRARLIEAAKRPSQLAFAVFPFESLVLCHYSVGDEVTEAADAVVKKQPRAEIAYSYYAPGADAGRIPKMHELWSDNVARREPRLDIVREAGRRLGVNGVLMTWYKCSHSQHVLADTYEVEVFLIDVNRDQVYRAKERFLDADRAISNVFDRFFAAYDIDPA